ncbi:MAG: hypothetical protein WBN79_01625 [Gemmatimonadota bacterium]
MRQLALSDIKTLEISGGQGSHTKGTIFGGLAGAFGGMLVGAAIGDDGDYGSLAGGLYGIFIGGATGAVLGWALLTPEKWVAVPVADLRLSLGPGLIYFQFGL